MLKETALHSGLVALATALYSVPLVIGVVSSAPRPPPPIPDDGDEIEVQARFSPLAVPLDPPKPDVPEVEEPPAATTPILPPSGSGPSVVTEVEPPPPTAIVRPGPPQEGAGTGLRPGAPRKARAAAAKRICDAPHPHVHVGADGVVEIDRSLVDQYTANLESFMELGFSRPFDEDGIKGWYISGFGCASPVFKAGFRRADVLLAVNGKPTRSWVGVFLLYQKLKNREDFEVALSRHGQPMTLRFRVVPG